MSTATKAEKAVSYAALILADDSIPITPEKLQTILKAAGLEDIEPIWTTLFAKALEGKDVKDILTKVAATGPAIGETKEEKKYDDVVEDSENVDCGERIGDSDDDEDFGMGLFG
jgi:large subunit ribosomal protein LP1